MAAMSEVAVLARRREILVARLDAQRGEIVGLIHELREPVRTVDRWWHLALTMGSVLPTVLLGGSVIGALWALLARRRRAGPARRSWVGAAFALWRIWRVAQAWLPAVQAAVGSKNTVARGPVKRAPIERAPIKRYGAVEV